MTIAGTKLEVAFKALRATGFFARANFLCCNGCACSDIATRFEEKAKEAKAAGKEPKIPTAYVFYHQQDNEAVKEFFGNGRRWNRRQNEEATLYLRYGSVDLEGREEKDSEEIGAEICAALKNAGITYEWDGDSGKCIEVLIKSAFEAVPPPVPVLHGRDLLMATFLDRPGGRKLTSEQFLAVYLACDGYGAVNEKFARAQCFDRSHVRDSSPEAVDRAVAMIEAFTSSAEAAA